MSLVGFAVRKLYWGKEATYGTPAAMSATLGIPQNFDSGVELVEEEIYAGGREYYDHLYIGRNVNPSADFYMVDGRFLPFLLGSVSNSGTAPPYTHVITLGTTLPSMTLEAVRGSVAERIVGALVSDWEIKAEADGIVEVSLDFSAKDISFITTYSDPNIPLPTTRPFKFTDMAVTWDNTTLGKVTSCSISGSNNLEPLPRQGEVIPGYAILTAEYSAELELIWESYDLALDFLNASKKDLVVKFIRATGDEIEFALNNCLLEWASEIDYTGDVMTQKISLKPKTIQITGKDSIEAW
jgi:hypothetical protein